MENQQGIAINSFHGKEAVKKEFLKRVRDHRKADQIVKGTYWREGKGCAVGCTIHSSNHAAYETELGVPMWLAYLEDELFEVMPNEYAMMWPEKFLKAIPVGKDEKFFDRVKFRFLSWLLIDPKDGTINVAANEKIKHCIQTIGDLFANLADGQVLTNEQIQEGNNAARAAWAAREAWEAREARAAREAREAREARAKLQSEKLIEILTTEA